MGTTYFHYTKLKLIIYEKRKPNLKAEINSGAPEGQVVPAPLVAPSYSY